MGEGEEEEESTENTVRGRQKEAYDEDSPAPKPSNPTGLIQYNPNNRASMQEAFDRMIHELRHVHDKMQQLNVELERLQTMLGENEGGPEFD